MSPISWAQWEYLLGLKAGGPAERPPGTPPPPPNKGTLETERLQVCRASKNLKQSLNKVVFFGEEKTVTSSPVFL